MAEDYIKITRKNLGEIAEKLKEKAGRVIFSGPDIFGFGEKAELSLYDHPLIEEDNWFYTSRGSKKNKGRKLATRWENDRSYSLRPIPEPTGDAAWNICRDLAEKLVLGKYQFEIGFQSTVGGTLFAENKLALFIPRENSLEPAFYHALSHAAKLINNKKKTISEEHVKLMLDYVMQDLNDKKVFRKNVSAGMEADSVLGL